MAGSGLTGRTSCLGLSLEFLLGQFILHIMMMTKHRKPAPLAHIRIKIESNLCSSVVELGGGAPYETEGLHAACNAHMTSPSTFDVFGGSELDPTPQAVLSSLWASLLLNFPALQKWIKLEETKKLYSESFYYHPSSGLY